MHDFLKAIENAQKLPDPADNSPRTPDFLGGINPEELVRQVSPDTPGKIPHSNEFAFEYRCARLRIGQEMTAMVNGNAEFEDIDESERLKEIIDMTLSGEAIVTKKLETFLKDGTIVIWLEWLEHKKLTSKKDRSYLTSNELLSPEHSEDEATKPENDEDEADPDESGEEDIDE